MASAIDWEKILGPHYKYTNIEIQAFKVAFAKRIDTKYIMRHILEVIKDDDRVDEGLRLMYNEAVYGSNKDVIKRVKDRISKMRTSRRFDPEIRRISMMHASDYGSMDMQQMKKSQKSAIQRDCEIAKALQKSYDEELAKMHKEREEKRTSQGKGDDGSLAEDSMSGSKRSKLKLRRGPVKQKVAAFDVFRAKAKPSAAASKAPDSSDDSDDDTDVIAESNTEPYVNLDEDYEAGTKASKVQALDDKENFNAVIDLEPGDVVLNDADSSSESCVSQNKEDENGDLKTYGRKKPLPKRKRLTPSIQPHKRAARGTIKGISKSDAEKQFNRVIRKKTQKKGKCDDLSFSSDDEEQDKYRELIDSYKPEAKKSKPSSDDELKEDIFRTARCMRKTGIDYQAMYLGMASVNGFDLQKMRDVAKKEMQDEEEKEEAKKKQKQDDSENKENIPPEEPQAVDPMDELRSLNSEEYVTDEVDEVDYESDQLVPDETPLYQNQMEDPAAQEAQRQFDMGNWNFKL